MPAQGGRGSHEHETGLVTVDTALSFAVRTADFFIHRAFLVRHPSSSEYHHAED